MIWGPFILLLHDVKHGFYKCILYVGGKRRREERKERGEGREGERNKERDAHFFIL